jgi:hypothetical protein
MVYLYCWLWCSIHLRQVKSRIHRSMSALSLSRRSAIVATTVALAVLALVSVSSAGAAVAKRPPTRVDRVTAKSEYTALRALQRYLNTRVQQLPSAQQSQEAFIASVGAKCPNALAALEQLKDDQVNKGAVTAFAEEAVDDLVLAGVVPSAGPLTDLTAALGPLHWPSPRWNTRISQSLDGERRYVAIAPSDLCADAQAFVSNYGQAAPQATLKFIAEYARAEHAAGLDGVYRTLGHFARPANARLLIDIQSSSNRLYAGFRDMTDAELVKLFEALGLDAS